MAVITPFLIFLEGSEMFTKFLKKRNIYSHWDIYHSFLVVAVLLLVVLWVIGYR